MRIHVSATYTARTSAGRALHDLHGSALQARPGTALPALEHLRWHRREVFKGRPLAA
jgi:putative restriction endonuclease